MRLHFAPGFIQLSGVNIPRITMRVVAKEAGVATSTVSKALRSDPSISAAQCRRIQQIARELGYRPDPLVSKLMADLHHHRRRADPLDIAWIDFWDRTPSGYLARELPAMLEGARCRAAELGYGVRVYRPAAEGVTPKRLSRILATCNQWGVIVPPVPDSAGSIPWDLNGFAAVTIGTSLQRPIMHRVSANHFQGAMLAFAQMRKRGFRRVGLALSDSMSARTEEKWLGAFHAASSHVRKCDRVPALLCRTGEVKALKAWLRQTAPDAVLVAEDWIGATLRSARRSPALAWLVRLPETDAEPALDYQPRQLGRVAMEMVVAQIHRNERGSPPNPHTMLLDAIWDGA